MSAFETRPFSTLSGGEKQRVVIAGALAQQADVLLLDEPTASLDPGHQLEIADLLSELNRTRGLGLVLSTHDLNLAASVCRDLVMLSEGSAIGAGPTGEVLTGANVERLYGIRADVRFHPRGGTSDGGPAQESFLMNTTDSDDRRRRIESRRRRRRSRASARDW